MASTMRAPIIAILLVLLSLSALALAQAPAAPAYRVIVHPSNTLSALDRDFVADAFLKKVARWPDGKAIRAADLDSHSPTRKSFVESVLKRSIAGVRSYWQQQIFSGRNIPPPELASDEAVIAFVLKYEGAIGYVSGAAKCDTVKVVSLK
jgi:ABC-type phosphate transport system substrate-binding protein